jgi:hypothetical protein
MNDTNFHSHLFFQFLNIWNSEINDGNLIFQRFYVSWIQIHYYLLWTVISFSPTLKPRFAFITELSTFDITINLTQSSLLCIDVTMLLCSAHGMRRWADDKSLDYAVQQHIHHSAFSCKYLYEFIIVQYSLW